MATLTVQSTAEDGGITFAAADVAGDEFVNDSAGRTAFVVHNGGGGSITVTVTAQETSAVVPGLGTVSKANGGGAVAAGATEVFGPFPQTAYNNASGRVEIEYSGVTTVTVAAIKVG